MRVVGYVRVSTEEQAAQGVSLEAQSQRIRDYCRLYDFDLVCIIPDEASGKSLARPGLSTALKLLRGQEAEGLVVAKLDRLTRSVKDLGELIDFYFGGESYKLVSVAEQIDTNSAAGRLVLHILTSVAQWERETIGERTSAAMQHKRRNGEFTGGFAPWGYRLVNGVLEVDAEEQNAILEARRLRKKGLSLRRIGMELLARDFRPRRNGEWAPSQVKCLLAAGEV
jgi:DNA invertase Pin-like site-specific DNA recombinase